MPAGFAVLWWLLLGARSSYHFFSDKERFIT
jgi:hypothetical protein